MLVAPAGYGKTTLARQWLADKPAVWYTATPASADVAALAAGLKEAVSEVVPGAGDALMERLTVTSRPEEEVRTLEAMLAGDLSGWPSNHWLVIDDYQEASESAAAETLIEHLLVDAPLNALIVSRRRPRWASSRRILYGEVFEIDREALAMRDEEAADMLGDAQSSASDVINAARGWPAVLALAAVSDTRPRGLVAEPKLYGFFADEIFGRLDQRTRQTLCELSLYDRGGRSVVLARLGAAETHRATVVGLASGFLAEQARGNVELHPLAKQFLQMKLREETAEGLGAVVSDAVATLIDSHRLWDEAYSLIAEFNRVEVLPHLVESAMDDLLATGRSATLRRWLGDSIATTSRTPPRGGRTRLSRGPVL